MYKLLLSISLCFTLLGTTCLTQAAPLNLPDTPIFLHKNAPPLALIILARDHKLYYEAYNDTSDLNGDGILDLRYKPRLTYANSTTIMDYYGYFDSHKCYQYTGTQFQPTGPTGTNKTCRGAWSGDFLNYLTTSRIDALRSVLYGGLRSTDSNDTTVLQRAHIPQDAHTWGKEYSSPAVDGYNISDYTPFANPAAGKQHLFANASLLIDDTQPRLRVLLNQTAHIADWVSIETPVSGNRLYHGATGTVVTPQDYFVKVKVCDKNIGLESNCALYPSGNYKPTGLLHQFGLNDKMKFGLLSGSYTKNLSGGVLRKNIGSFDDEINSKTGQFSDVNGIVKTINSLKTVGFSDTGGAYQYGDNCGWIRTRAIREGECRPWGNPIAEMMYEGLRYFAGKNAPTPAFNYSGGDDATLGLPQPAWKDPYNQKNNKYCAKPNFLVISDINPSYDSDQLPGVYSAFGSFANDLPGNFNASTLADTIWSQEIGGSKNIFIGQMGSDYDGAPTAKTATSLATLRGLTPDEPAKQGSYYAASAAYYGHENDISSRTDAQKISTYAIALSSPLPQITIPVNGKIISVLPFAKTVGNCGNGPQVDPDPTRGQFQPTNSLADFYVNYLTPSSGSFQVSFDDQEQGADFDMDALATYQYTVNNNGTVTIDVTVNKSAGCLIQHVGYTLSGTTADGIYLVTRDIPDPGHESEQDVDYFLDVPNIPGALPTHSSRTFSPSSSSNSSATSLNSPLWYAAKWGGFTDSNDNHLPDLKSEWDANNDNLPDNYFLVTNPATLNTQLTKALNNIINKDASITSVALGSNNLNTSTYLYQTTFNTLDWSSHLLAFSVASNGSINQNGSAMNGALWDAAQLIGTLEPSSRTVLSYNDSTKQGIALRWATLSDTQKNALNIDPETSLQDNKGSKRLDYLRGDTTQELQNGGTLQFRDRSNKLGDIIDSNVNFVSNQAFINPAHFTNTQSTEKVPYATYLQQKQNNTPMIYVGSNDGMLHGFHALTGVEMLAYVPNTVFPHLSQLTSGHYTHQYYVNGPVNVSDAFFSGKGQWRTVLVGGLNKGGRAIYALDISSPSSFNESAAKNIVLWEYTDPDLGFTYSSPSVVRLPNGQWAAVFGNGYNSTGKGEAILYIVNIETGALIRKINTGIGMTQDPSGKNRPNGLATPAVISANLNSISTHVYAGDLFGNLWKFDLSSKNTSDWDVAIKQGSNKLPLFVALDPKNNRQAITSRPTVGAVRNKLDTVQIYFGTGKYLEPADEADTSIQTFYAIEDVPSNTQSVVTRNNLLAQSIIGEQAAGTQTYRTVSTVRKKRTDRGWLLDLIYRNNPTGERIISTPILRGSNVIFTTLVPSSKPCEDNTSGWLMELNAQDGSRLYLTPFDVNNDGKFTQQDLINGAVTSGLKSQIGLIANPAVYTTASGTEKKYLSGSSGKVGTVLENVDSKETKRQSWLQLK